MKKYFSATFSLCLLSGCGGSPKAILSVTNMRFGSEVVGTTSSAQPMELTNTGSEKLNIASIAASANFAQTNNCGSALAAGATCT